LRHPVPKAAIILIKESVELQAIQLIRLWQSPR